MSVSRDVIAEVMNMTIETVKCENCARRNKDSHWCRIYNSPVKNNDFCSLFINKEKSDEHLNLRKEE